MAKDGSFLGTGWGFPPSFERGPLAVAMISDEEDIRSSLEILLSTGVGERVMWPLYGCDMHRLLFEPLDTTLQAYMEDLIRTAILYFEPRILLNEVTLAPQSLEGRIDIVIDYTVAATNTRTNYVYPYYRREGTEVMR